MAQIISGSALKGRGVLIDQIIGSQLDNANFNTLVIENTGTTSHYINIEAEDKTGPAYFDEGGGLCFSIFSADQAGGVDMETNFGSMAGVPAGTVISWERGAHEYRFILTDDTPFPSDEVLGKSPSLIYNFYVKHAPNASLLANNLADKVNAVKVDGLNEYAEFISNAGFSAFRAFKTSEFNDLIIYKDGVSFLTVQGPGSDPYPRAGGTNVNSSSKVSVLSNNIPFVAGGYGVTIIVPPLANYKSRNFQIQMASTSTDIAANTFRVKSSTSNDDLVVKIFGKTS